MTNLEIAKRLVKVRRVRVESEPVQYGWAVYAPGLPGLSRMQGVHTDKSGAEKRARQIEGHVAAILDAAERVRKAGK